MRFLSLAALLCASPLLAADRPDVVVADFEGDTYGDWKATGTAFGNGPAKGTLPNQMPVTGFLGKGLVNSYAGGDRSTGTLTSPEFKIERKFINFLVGGGGHAKTHVKLFVEGVERGTARGPNTQAGGSERLEWTAFDVAQFEGKTAKIVVTDEETGGWGHINADHFVQSDRSKEARVLLRPIGTDKRYLHLPVKNGTAVRRVTVSLRFPDTWRVQLPDKVVREFDIELADGVEPDFWVFLDISAFKGNDLVVACKLSGDSKALASLKTDDDIPDAEKTYREKHRPLFHFTSRVGWLNDPNGLVFVPTGNKGFGAGNGEWHLFYQHNPYGREWGNMHWGHAVSTDLMRWKELGIGLYPKKYGDWAFSGSAVLDKQNTSGWGTKEKPPLVLAYTSTGRGECIAFSTDDGRTWTEYDKNPVVKHVGRDPKLLWHEPTKQWVMAVYTEADKKQWIAFHTSPDLKTWTFASRIDGFFECPDLFELMVNMRPDARKWVLHAADGKYLVGDFDGKEFKPDHKDKKQLWYGRFYAAQSFDGTPTKKVPGGGLNRQNPPRRVQIGWGQGITFPGTAFNQQMSIPVELGLANEVGDGKLSPVLTAHPVQEVELLREREPVFRLSIKDTLTVTEAKTLGTDLDAFDLHLTLLPSKSLTGFTLDLRGTKLVYDAAKGTLACKDVVAPVKGRSGELNLRVLVDRGSVEVFADNGRVAMSVAAIPDEKNRDVVLTPAGGSVLLRGGGLWRMRSAWGK